MYTCPKEPTGPYSLWEVVDLIQRDKEFAEFDAQMAEFQRQHLEMLEKRQQDTASARAAKELDDDLLAAGVR